MDVGKFRRGKWGITPWLATPFVLCVSTYLGTVIYCEHVKATLEKLETVVQVVPAAEQKILKSCGALETALGEPLSTGAGKYAFRPAAELPEMAAESDIDILAVRSEEVREEVENAASAPSAITSTKIKTSGSLAGMINFIDAVYIRHPLLVLDAINLRKYEDSGKVLYAAEFTVRSFEVACPRVLIQDTLTLPEEAAKLP